MALHRVLRPAVTAVSHPTVTGDPVEGVAPAALAEAVELYHRTYTTLLRSSGETRLRVLESSHRAMGSSLHPLAASPELDLGAFLYAGRRLPLEILHSSLVVMGQSSEVFARHGYNFDSWAPTGAPGRRRRWYHDGGSTLAVLVASASDVDDLVPTLVAFQIEWNKLHQRLRAGGVPGAAGAPPSAAECAAALGGREEDWAQLIEIWGDGFRDRLAQVAGRRLSLRVRMLGGTQVGSARVTRRWWAPVLALLREQGVADRPVYFVSSNSHSVVNLVSGAAAQRQRQLVDFIDRQGPAEMREELRRFRAGTAEGDWSNFLYYAARLYFRSLPHDHPEQAQRREEERRLGIFHVVGDTALDIAAQVIVLDRLDTARLDPRLLPVDAAALGGSPAVVVNIDYPLGQSAYNILREIAETVGELRGVYTLGKAATLNADVGDVMLSSVVHDEHSGNTFWLDNAFGVNDIAPFLRFGSGLDNQRAVTVKGTFLQNRGHLDFYYREAFTVVEMEAGPYCAAMYELSESGRYPTNEPVNFSKLPIDFGVIHYASDTPFTQARTLGARGLSYHGMDSTYASSVAIIRRVLRLEGALGDGEPAVTRSTHRLQQD
ncbi:MAG TPA: hypothetical protein VGP96_07325 [Candidatus Dormibacteraeota bacterium]|nr:hypothetical protein [Candidatus Dormibacteraeota bacterium]